MSISDGLGSRKAEVLADTAVTLEQGEDGLVATEIIKKLLSVRLQEGRREHCFTFTFLPPSSRPLPTPAIRWCPH